MGIFGNSLIIVKPLDYKQADFGLVVNAMPKCHIVETTSKQRGNNPDKTIEFSPCTRKLQSACLINVYPVVK